MIVYLGSLMSDIPALTHHVFVSYYALTLPISTCMTLAGVGGVSRPVEADADGGAVEAHHHPGHHEPPLVPQGPAAGHP